MGISTPLRPATIYCLRQDISLNQGCLKPIKVKIPPKFLLSPSDNAAVVGGNVFTSQRVTDVTFKAFRACAASQGDCNNLTFGYGGNIAGQDEVKGFGYYETISGGSGAGTSGVHTHMTNTRIIGSEIFERRYPVILRGFSIRKCSGGAGQHRGGDGVVRDIEFRIPLQVSILSERRVHHPYGLAGGVNVWVRQVEKATWEKQLSRLKQGKNDKAGETEGEEVEYEERHVNLGAKNSAPMKAGDRIIINTPGGCGCGKVGEAKKHRKAADSTQSWRKGTHAAREEASLQV